MYLPRLHPKNRCTGEVWLYIYIYLYIYIPEPNESVQCKVYLFNNTKKKWTFPQYKDVMEKWRRYSPQLHPIYVYAEKKRIYICTKKGGLLQSATM